jgi:hypothetical protein
MAASTVVAPNFARNLAAALSDVQGKRHDADYDLNKQFSGADARLLISRVRRVIADWHAANSTVDGDFKHALYY